MDNLDIYAFGDVLRGFRNRAGMSQEKLAQELHLTRGTIVNWERGDYRPLPERIKEIAHILRLSERDTATLVRARWGNIPIPDNAADKQSSGGRRM